jgi:hypothetical protein
MSVPTTRKEFAEYCLRKLGKPVVEVNVDPDQVDDRIDEALRYYYDYHFDGSDKVYYKWRFTSQFLPGAISEIEIYNGGTGYANGETITFSDRDPQANGADVNVSVNTNANGTITGFNFIEHGTGYMNEPQTITINTTNGSGAVLKAYNGGYIPLPDNVIGAVNIFDIGQALNTNNLFNIRYQIALNDLYTLTSVSMVPYYMALQHVQFLEAFLVGKQPLRYNRNRNKLYIDVDWTIVQNGDTLIVEVYQVINPDIYKRAWSEFWLQKYTTCLIKQQWGTNLKKFGNMQMPGGLVFNGQQIFDEANEERKQLEQEMVYTWSLPATDMIG